MRSLFSRFGPGALLLFSGCQAHNQPLGVPVWDAQPTPISGPIYVASPLVAAETPDLNLEGFLGEKLADGWAQGRIRRTAQLSELPYTMSDALVGQLYGTVMSDWEHHFRPLVFSKRKHQELLIAVHAQNNLHPSFSALAKENGGGGTLFLWVTELAGHPFTSDTMSGELIFHDDIPVMVDGTSEPYRVEMSLGASLYDGEGQLAFHYEDAYQAVLSESQNTRNVAKELARELVQDLSLIWPQPGQEHKERLVHHHP